MTTRFIELGLHPPTLNVEGLLLNRLDPALDGVYAYRGKPIKITGIGGYWADTGYIVGRIAGQTVWMIDLPTLNALSDMLLVDLAVPEGLKMSFHVFDSQATPTNGAITIRYEE